MLLFVYFFRRITFHLMSKTKTTESVQSTEKLFFFWEKGEKNNRAREFSDSHFNYVSFCFLPKLIVAYVWFGIESMFNTSFLLLSAFWKWKLISTLLMNFSNKSFFNSLLVFYEPPTTINWRKQKSCRCEMVQNKILILNIIALWIFKQKFLVQIEIFLKKS